MALLKESFVLLTAILNNILYVNVPYGVKNMAICFSCENRSDYTVMSLTNINGGRLPVFYYKELPIVDYKLKLIFKDGTEGDTEWIKNGNVSNVVNDFKVVDAEAVINNFNNVTENIIALLSIILTLLSFVIIYIIIIIFIKCIRKAIADKEV